MGHIMESQRISDAAAQPIKPRGRPFQPGQSGNPSGRPKGARNKATLAVEALLENEAEALTRKVIDLALGGNMAALRLCFERLLPPRRNRGVAFDQPKIECAADALAASGAVLESCALPCYTMLKSARTRGTSDFGTSENSCLARL